MVDLDELDPTAFFRLGDELQDRPRVRLGKRKQFHKWGQLSLWLKAKVWKRVESGEIRGWEELTFRAIVSYSQHIWRRWYALCGLTLHLLAMTMFPLCDSVCADADVQRRIYEFVCKNWGLIED